MITLTQLEYVVAVDTYRHFANAAEKCLVTQPTLSMQIKKLEEYLGVTIFDRSRQPVVPTDVGRQIIDQARIIIRESKKLEELAQHYHQHVSGRLKIGIIPTLAPYLLPLFLGRMMERHPGIKLNIREMMTQDIMMELKKDELDVGILATPLHDENITEEPVFYEEIKIYTQYGHILSKKGKVSPELLATRKDIWMLADGNCFRNHVINLCHTQLNADGEETLRYESGSLETLKKMVETEGGFTLLPELAVLELSARQLGQVVSFDGAVPLREIGLVYVRNAAKRDLINVLKDAIADAVPEEMLDKNRGVVVEWK
jgi:LysR family transcriptional regulator, hydrogen peroxide-inducible genes activator